jgi:hypothetical protein
MSQEGTKQMSKEIGWEPGTTETSQRIREDLLKVLMQHGMATSLEDCLDFMYETMIIAGAGAFAAGLTEDQAASFFKAALEDIYSATVLAATMSGERAEA